MAEDYQNYVNRVMAQDSPLMQRARAFSDQQMTERGLRNSSMAVEASQNAVLDNAMKIAEPTYKTDTNIDEINLKESNARMDEYVKAQMGLGTDFQKNALSIMNDPKMKADQKKAYINQLSNWATSESSRTKNLFTGVPGWGTTAGVNGNGYNPVTAPITATKSPGILSNMATSKPKTTTPKVTAPKKGVRR
jgi:hypothetical protein